MNAADSGGPGDSSGASILWHSLYVRQLLFTTLPSFVTHVYSLCLQPFVEARQGAKNLWGVSFLHNLSTPGGVMCMSDDF